MGKLNCLDGQRQVQTKTRKFDLHAKRDERDVECERPIEKMTQLTLLVKKSRPVLTLVQPETKTDH